MPISAKLLLERLQLATAIVEELDILPVLQQRVNQRLDELMTRCEEALASSQGSAIDEILTRNQRKMKMALAAADRIQKQMNDIAEKMRPVGLPTAGTASLSEEKRLNKTLSRGLRTLMFSQSLLEMQLIELDRIAMKFNRH